MKSVYGGPVRGHVQVELLSAYLDQQATPAERAFIHAHLQECVQCRAELDSLRRTVLLLQALPRVAVPRAFTLSEAQVGIRRPAGSPGWFGGLVRGLGAVAAIAVVALVAFALLRPDDAPWNPPQSVARAVPTSEPVATVMETRPMSAAGATEAQAPAEAPAAATEVQEPTLEAVEPTPEPAPSEPALMAAAPPESPTADAAADTAAAPATSAMEVAPLPSPTAEAPLVAKAAASATSATVAPVPEMGAAAMGRGGGGGSGGGPSGPMGIPSEFLTPEATPAGRSLADALPSGMRLAYSDLNALWAIDRDGGVRQLVQGRGINTPQLSTNEQWVVYRTFTDQGMQVWAIRWEGGLAKLLLDDATLPLDGLPAGYVRRAINDTRWAPEGNVLAVTMTLIPDPNNAQPPRIELWQVDVETGTLRRSGELGRAWRPYYSPDGKAYLVLQYGTEEKPEGSLNLVETKSGKTKTLFTFAASVGKIGYDNQVAWAPDSKIAWVAIPTADYGTPLPPNGTKVYRVTAPGGDVKEVGEIDAVQVNWSPTAAAMAYTRYTDETLANNELYLAKPDGSQAELYTPMVGGEFIAWSPKGTRFIYQDNFQVFAGATGQPPTRLANASSMNTPRWISETQILASHDTGSGWLLTLRDVNGDAAGLLPLPRETMWDAGSN